MKRNVGLCILFSFITCGIYTLYWMYKITEDVNYYSDDSSTSPGLAILLSFVTCGIYFLYWTYKMGKQIEIGQERAGIRSSDDSVLYLILSIFGLSIIAMAIMQSNINKMVGSHE